MSGPIEHPSPVAAHPPWPPAVPARPRVLLIDASSAQHERIQQLLGADHDLAFAHRGAQGLALAQSWAPQLVLMDLLLHDRDGFEVLAALHQDPQTASIPVVFVTAQGGDQIESQCLQAGAVDFVPKAAHPAVLRARVQAHLGRVLQAQGWRDHALRDALTGLANRTQLDERLVLEWGRAQRNGTPLTLVVLDVDAFAVYNRQYGRVAGDDGLRRLAQLLREGVRRPADLVARLDGDGFACLLPDVPHSDGMAMAQRWLQALRDQAMAHHFSPVAPVWTASVGVATHQATAPVSSGHALLALALAGLDDARASGGACVRARVSLSTPDAEPPSVERAR